MDSHQEFSEKCQPEIEALDVPNSECMYSFTKDTDLKQEHRAGSKAELQKLSDNKCSGERAQLKDRHQESERKGCCIHNGKSGLDCPSCIDSALVVMCFTYWSYAEIPSSLVCSQRCSQTSGINVVLCTVSLCLHLVVMAVSRKQQNSHLESASTVHAPRHQLPECSFSLPR